MSDLYEVVKTQIDAVVAEAKASLSDNKLSISEVWALTTKVIGAFVMIMNELDIDNADKKAIVLKAAERLYDEVIAPIDIAAIPNAVEPLVDKLGRSAFVEIVSGVIDGTVAVIKKVKGA
jgi:hypothetical protein